MNVEVIRSPVAVPELGIRHGDLICMDPSSRYPAAVAVLLDEEQVRHHLLPALRSHRDLFAMVGRHLAHRHLWIVEVD